MATIVTSNTTTQLLVKSIGTDVYTSLKLPSEQVTMDDVFFQNKSVNAVMPQIYIDVCGVLTPDESGICTWTIRDDEATAIKVTNQSLVMSIKDSSGNVVLAANELITYGSAPDATYALNIYIKSDESIPAETYTAVIKL